MLPPAARELSAVLGSGRRVLELTDREPAVQDPRDPLATPPGTPAIALEGVSARYSDVEPPALEHVDLTLEPGRKLALVGPSGVGKTTDRAPAPAVSSTRTKVVSRSPVRTCGGFRQEDVRRAIAVAGQDAYLFSTSIRENVRLGRPQASDAEVDAALRAAKVGDWVSSLPDGAETLVGEEGTQLSGGQRQRIALARALLSEAPVLVLDEPTAHLDHETAEALVRDMLEAADGAVGPAHHPQARRPRPRRRGRRDGLGSDVMAEVEVTRDGGVLTLTLNRPDVLNAFNTAMHKAFQAALKEAGDASVRAVVITGEGRGFCVGQDLTEFQEGAGDIGDRLRAGYHKNILAIRALEKPVIAAVNGPAAGAGLSLACACDIRLAGESASFVPAFIGIGLVPDSGGSYFIARLLGAPRAFEWMSQNRKLSAADALTWGLVTEVVADETLPARAAELAGQYAQAPTRGVGMTKRLFDNAQTATLDEQLELEAQLQAAATQTDDFREGVTAFLEKRPPQFTGS